MRKLLFLVVCGFPLVSQGAILSNLRFTNVSYASWQAHVTVTGSYDQLRMLSAIAPTVCSNSATSGVLTEAWLTGGGGSSLDIKMDTSGKTPDTVYNVCPQVSVGGVWTGGPTGQIKTLSRPGGGALLPPHAAMVNSAYSAEIAAGSYTTIGSSCANLKADLDAAVATSSVSGGHNTVITLPAGQNNGCTSTLYLDEVWPDEKQMNNTAVNSDGSLHVPAHGWSDGQQLKFARNSSGDEPNGLVQADFYGPDGRSYYVRVKGPDDIWIYNRPYASGGNLIKLTANSGSFRMVPYPRQVKDIIIRTATPDAQFAAPGTALGSMSWNAKMAWFINPASHRSQNGLSPVVFGKNGDTYFQSMATHVRFVGIAFTVADDAVSYGEVDPAPWPYLLPLATKTQDIGVDRCSFFMPSEAQRLYTAVQLVGTGNYLVGNWFDSSLHAYHAMNWSTPVTTSNNTFTVGNNGGTSRITAGVYQTAIPANITVTLSGAPSVLRRVTAAFPMSNTNKDVLQVYIPSGVTGSCTGGPCSFTTRDVSSGGACDTSNRAEWPLDGAGEVSVRTLACWDMSTSGTLTNFSYTTSNYSDKGFYAGGVEGTQLFQGSYGPGPITFRDNNLFLTGNTMHFADDGGLNSFKSDIWIYRNQFRAFWPGMYGAAGQNGMDYGNRNHAVEAKGVANITIEGNLFGGNFNDKSQASGSDLIFFRAKNQGGGPGEQNGLIIDNFFEHVAGGVQLGDLLACTPGSCSAPSLTNALVNNVFLDVNQLGPDNGCIHALGCLPSGTGSYASYFGEINSGQGWMANGPIMTEGFLMRNNTMPDFRGSIPVLFYTSNQVNGGLVIKDNFLSVRSDASAFGLGARQGDSGYPPGCSGSGYNLLTCFWKNSTVTGNVVLSQVASQATISADGWGATNTIPASPANLTAIWPKYNINPCGGAQPWTCDIDPEVVRLPAGSAYTGKGADITELRSVMGYVDNPQAAFDVSNNLKVSWLAPDSAACTVDAVTSGSLYNMPAGRRFSLDTGGGRSRKITIPAANFSSATAYDVRINCERFSPVVSVRSN